jgi:FK506-binding protein 2
MARIVVAMALLWVAAGAAEAKHDFTELGIGVKFKPEHCHLKAHKGDLVSVHYRGTLADGTEFDNSHSRGQPLDFKLGQGTVIKGWDQGILGMCVGERRKLKIPAKLAYGEESVAVSIPAGASLIFDTELVAVNGRTGPGPFDVVEELLGDIPSEDLEFGDPIGSF